MPGKTFPRTSTSTSNSGPRRAAAAAYPPGIRRANGAGGVISARPAARCGATGSPWTATARRTRPGVSVGCAGFPVHGRQPHPHAVKDRAATPEPL